MNQDILNLNRTTKSILKNPDNRSSLAFSNSILRKDPSKINTEGIGFNPNLGVEDEYISNLQKQIHFMDLEIKLMKEKQQQDEALGGNYNFTKIGIKDGFESSMDHIITATAKIKELRTAETIEINSLENERQILERQNEIERAKLLEIKKILQTSEERNSKVFSERNTKLNEIKTKLLDEKKMRENVEADIARLQAQFNAVLKENEKLIRDTDLKNINQALSEKRFEQDQKFDEETNLAKLEIIQNLEKEKTEYFRLIENDQLLQGYRKDNELLQDKLKEIERQLNEARYEVLQYETLQKLSDEQKEAEIAERKKLQLDLEKWKTQLEDTVKNNEIKIEKKLRESVSADIKLAQANLLKEERDLAELKKKYQAIEENERNYIIDESNRKRNLENLLKKNDEVKELNDKLDSQIAAIEPDVENLIIQIKELSDQIEENGRKKDRYKKDLTEVVDAKIELDSKYKHLSQTTEYNKVVNQFLRDAENLNSLRMRNNHTNTTIEKFMNVWNYLKNLQAKDY